MEKQSNFGHKKDFLKSRYDFLESEILLLRQKHNLSFQKICSLLQEKSKSSDLKAQSMRKWFNSRYYLDKSSGNYCQNMKYENYKKIIERSVV